MASYTAQIIEALHRALCAGPFGADPKGKISGDGPWTSTILKTLSECGKQNGYQGHTQDGAATTNKEKWAWFFDHVWTEYNKVGDIVAFPLVAECELNTENKVRWGRQRADFEKLLCANSPYRLFICQLDSKNHRKEEGLDNVENALLDKLCVLLKTYRWAEMGAVTLIVILQFRGTPKYLKCRELVCGHSGWEHRDDIRYCS